MAWSTAQLAAITTYDKNLLVAAAAGSGKTAVLVERIIRRLLDDRQGFNIDEVLVLTFTNAAAAEMRQRIGAALTAAIDDGAYNEHLQRQLILLNSAAISTFHAFCQSLVRQYFHQLNVDPKFRLANVQESQLLRREVAESVFERFYEAGESGFLAFVEQYGSERSDEALYALVLTLYEYSRSQPYPRQWLDELAAKFALPLDASVEDTEWIEIIRRHLALVFDECAALTDELIETAERLECDFYLPAYQADRDLFERLAAAVGRPWAELGELAAGSKLAALKRAPKDTDETAKEILKKQREAVRSKFNAVQTLYFSTDGAAWLADLQTVQPAMTALVELTKEFAVAFTAAKQEKNIVDFSDLEHLTLELLRDDAGEPTPAALTLQKKYCEIMVDEYQDTNSVQEAILELLRRREEPNLFYVGDVKQSVYRFRLAEPELFMQKYRGYPAAGPAYERIDLAQNFRSRPEVLAAINFVFKQLMAPSVAELAYGAVEYLNPGLPYPATDRPVLGGATQLYIIDRAADGETDASEHEAAGSADDTAELKGFELEARLIARCIKELVQAGKTVYDKSCNSYRPLNWRDIVILLRSVKNKAPVLLEALRSADIPAYADVSGGYFAEIEVKVMLALLSVIDNPRQDIPLASVLNSPIGGFNAAELAKLRLAGRDGDFYAALTQASSADDPLGGRAREFLQRLERWRDTARQRSVPELIWQLFNDTGYYDYVGATPGGALRQANLRMLYDRSREYEKTNFRGLFRFLRFVEKMQTTGTDLAVARTLGESENVVRIMTIHKSKGLEFPVVIAADLGKGFNLSDAKDSILLHKRYGLGPYVVDTALGVRYPTLPRLAIARQLTIESKAEELRVLYVALTRAREQLILIGSTANLASKAAKWRRAGQSEEPLLPAYVIAGATSYLDWIGSSVVRHPDGKALRDYAGGDSPCPAVRSLGHDDAAWQVEIVNPAALAAQPQAADGLPDERSLRDRVELPASPFAGEIAAILDWRYPNAALQQVPAKMSVTEMKRQFAVTDDSVAQLIERPLLVRRPAFLQQRRRLSGAEYGTLMHSVMQHIDYHASMATADLSRQLERLAVREIIDGEQLPMVDIEAIQRYFASELGVRMRRSPVVRRELPFSIMLPAQDFYPQARRDDAAIFVQGVIDVLFDEPDGLVLVDYKTDGGALEAVASRYRLQLKLYARAIGQILNKPVKESYLYLLRGGHIVRL